MTFTEAAIEVLRREGKPMHFRKIAEIAVRDSLLDHVGKTPEETMGGQLASHCRLPRAERRLMAVQPATFALLEWGLEEDPMGLEGILEPPAENEPPLRPRERHPIPARDMARGAGRGEARGRRREEGERRGRRFPPPAEVAYEILAGSDHPLSLTEIAALGAERLLMPDAFVRDGASLAAALAEDNRRRESSGRRPLFGIEGETVSLAAQPEPGERAAAPAPSRAASPAEMRRAGLSALRRRLRECDAPTLEHVTARLLERTGLRDLKVAKRAREHVVYTGRRRMGLGEVRHCVRILRGGGDVDRRDVSEVRRDLGHYGAQIGMLISVGEAARDARAEALAAGQLPVLLLCGEALAEGFADGGLGCRLVAVPEVDEAFFQAAAETAEKEEAVRRARREERDRREREGRPRAPERAVVEGEAAPAVEATVPGGGPPPTELGAAAEAEGEEAEEGEESEEAEGAGEQEVGEGAGEPAGQAASGPGGPGEGKRRRRRRRRRGGRGRGQRERGSTAGASAGQAGAGPDAGTGAAQDAGTGAGPDAGTGAAQAAPSQSPAPVPVAGGGESGSRE